MTMPILRGHLTEHQLSTGGDKQALVKRLLTDLQSGQEPSYQLIEPYLRAQLLAKKVKLTVNHSPQHSRLHLKLP